MVWRRPANRVLHWNSKSNTHCSRRNNFVKWLLTQSGMELVKVNSLRNTGRKSKDIAILLKHSWHKAIYLIVFVIKRWILILWKSNVCFVLSRYIYSGHFFLSDFVFSPLTTVDIIRILWSKNNANLIFCAFNYFFKSFLNLKISKKLWKHHIIEIYAAIMKS